jgi:hypothetical protein
VQSVETGLAKGVAQWPDNRASACPDILSTLFNVETIARLVSFPKVIISST